MLLWNLKILKDHQEDEEIVHRERLLHLRQKQSGRQKQTAARQEEREGGCTRKNGRLGWSARAGEPGPGGAVRAASCEPEMKQCSDGTASQSLDEAVLSTGPAAEACGCKYTIAAAVSNYTMAAAVSKTQWPPLLTRAGSAALVQAHQESGDKVQALGAALERQHDAKAEGKRCHERPATSQCWEMSGLRHLPGVRSRVWKALALADELMRARRVRQLTSRWQ
jgi:hypothetical protein